MKKKYFIYAYDEVYKGTNGVFETFLFEGDFKDACEIGLDMSYDIICAHPSIIETLNEKRMTIEDDMAYEVWEVLPNAPKSLDETSPKDFIKKFCKQPINVCFFL